MLIFKITLFLNLELSMHKRKVVFPRIYIFEKNFVHNLERKKLHPFSFTCGPRYMREIGTQKIGSHI